MFLRLAEKPCVNIDAKLIIRKISLANTDFLKIKNKIAIYNTE
jgi:hypothetical protein